MIQIKTVDLMYRRVSNVQKYNIDDIRFKTVILITLHSGRSTSNNMPAYSLIAINQREVEKIKSTELFL